MSYTSEDYRQMWAAETVGELREQTLMLQLTSQRFTAPWVAGARQINVPKPDWAYNSTDNEGVRAVERARGGDWATALDGDQSVVPFARTGGYASSNVVDWEDAVELPWPAVERTRSRQRYELTRQIEHAVFGAITSSIAAEPSTPNHTGYGNGDDYIDRMTGRASSDDALDLPYMILDDFSLKLEEANADGSGDAVGTKYCLMNPVVFRALRDGINQKRYQWDVLTRDLLVANSVLAGIGYRGRLLGIDIFSWNGIPKPSGVGANTAADRDHNWQVLCGVREAIAADVRPPLVQYFGPQENQVTSNPAHLLRQAGDYGYAPLELSLMTLATIDGGADAEAEADA
ncbi:MAG: hypothetical protein OXQ93_13965 [Gemmatimonadota bacterium]|nr:hypothetical protein [Gemmatimonadota bacterium]